MTAAEQARVFAVMAACGGVLGAAYDCMRPLRRGGMTHVADLFMGALAAAGMIAAALYMQTEVFRLYAFAGILAGAALYAATIGMIVRKVAIDVRSFVKKRENLRKKVRADAGKSKKGANV